MSRIVQFLPRRRWLRWLLIGTAIAVPLVFLFLSIFLTCGCADVPTRDISRIDQHRVLEYDYPRWRAAHPGHDCPALSDLSPSVSVDGWGTPYRLTCSSDATPTIEMTSAGPDRVMSTADDIAARWNDAVGIH